MNAIPEDDGAFLDRLYQQYADKLAEVYPGIPPAGRESPQEELDRLTARYSAEIAIGLAQARAKESRSDEKRLANLRARCALVGVQLHAIEGDDGLPLYCCTKWAMTVALRDLDDLAAWVHRVDGKSE